MDDYRWSIIIHFWNQNIPRLFPSTEDAKSRATKRKKVAVPKDPNAPKRPVTAYIIFSTEVRQKLHSDQPEMGFVELMKHIGGLWNKLPAKDKQVATSFIKYSLIQWNTSKLRSPYFGYLRHFSSPIITLVILPLK